MASLYQQWDEMVTNLKDDQREDFAQNYYDRETDVYKKILSDQNNAITGSFEQLAEQNGFDHILFAGFMDGINDSLKQPYDLDELVPESEIKLDVDFEKLYWNMLDAGAPWLYDLEEWDGVLTPERRKEIDKDRKKSMQAVSTKVDRNAPCPCGSGKKYKKCCGSATASL